ncbi:hypothetical protein [Vibrio rotiferianus]|uniref:hypothetical protein n=1 Tax=Vibrio rotiferianus TaxID=190895 RepID=UPI0011100079|nr:hypothetical protein [Vibrio rotiferianus]TMX70626.1 hypothetical protein DA097_05165 [Vibrio rotiferianus]
MAQNIKEFDRVVAFILSELYQKFPVRTHVSIYEVFDCPSGKITDYEWVESEELKQSDQEFYYFTVQWLLDTGYVIGTINHYNDSKITLSMKGLELLKSVPSSVDSSESIGDQLVSAFKSGAKDSAANIISKALSSTNLFAQLSDLFASSH